jgi:hypothetical protein
MFDYQTLRTLVAGMVGTSAEKAAQVNALPDVNVPSPMRVTKTTVYATIGFAAGLQLLAFLKAGAVSNDPATALKFGEVLDLMRPEGGGLDIANPDAIAFIDALPVQAISADNAAKLKALGTRAAPVWQALGFPQPVLPGDVEWAEGGGN